MPNANLKIVVLTTDEHIFGRELVKVLLKSRFKISAVIAERGNKFVEACKSYLKSDFYSPPHFSEISGIREFKMIYVKNANSSECHQKLSSLAPDVIALGGARILKDYIINTAKVGVLNCHPGLLPDYKGRDPVGWAIYNGDDIGMTCHFVDSGVDTGPILIRRKAKWQVGESLLEIRVRLMRSCAKLMTEALRSLEEDSIKAEPQIGKGKYYSSMPPKVASKVERILSGKI